VYIVAQLTEVDFVHGRRFFVDVTDCLWVQRFFEPLQAEIFFLAHVYAFFCKIIFLNQKSRLQLSNFSGRAPKTNKKKFRETAKLGPKISAQNICKLLLTEKPALVENFPRKTFPSPKK
jgi:hypothetical protein